MSGPNETRDSAEEPGASSGPASEAPPSFGNADPAAGEPDRPSAQTSPEKSEEAPADKPGTVGLPPFMLQRPWWATDEDDDTGDDAENKPQTASDGADAESGPDEQPAPGAEPAKKAPAKTEPAKTEPAKTEAAKPKAAAPESAESSESSEPPVGTDPLPAPTPGTLVAGAGAPGVDTRGAVPTRQPAPPSAAETEPDIPVVRVDDDSATPGKDKPAGTEPAGGKPAGPQASDDDTAPIPRTEIPAPAAPAPGPAASPNQPTAATPPYRPDNPAPFGGPGYTAPTQTFPAAPADQGAPTAPAPSGKKRGNRKALLAAGGVAGALVVAAGAYVLLGSGSGGDGREAAPAGRTPTSAQQPQAPAASPTGATTVPAPSQSAQASINNVKTDPKPLALVEAFPTKNVTVGGRSYVRDKASVNHNCALTARGAMAQALQRAGCTSVVRVTFLDKQRSVAVTSGIAVLPNHEAALRASRAGDPSKYEWFRGMAGSRTKDIDRAGGYAASTVRGRYIVYSYAQYANGRRPQPGDALQNVARQFIDYGVRPIDARARQRR
ncbi:hypothetical protein Acsp04_25210 [Actinomadura sp. NBRC 104425]|uniref:hypothetical protein n=1 Tax=Actinomadura sp. NBRC 104425 TaxID=3032204 RepID=UPI0024A3590A|nr:hypothetical protein [Actinomadura sp. NBRC 104425]GLZ12286.1 hypothetical protein Acsp04_25210 [Actinomadura sp. NBRC 104425]